MTRSGGTERMTRSCSLLLIPIACLLGSAAPMETAGAPPAPALLPPLAARVITTSSDASFMTTSGAFFALSVADVKASADWYVTKLGLKIVMQPPKTDQSTVIVLAGGGLTVELLQQ